MLRIHRRKPVSDAMIEQERPAATSPSIPPPPPRQQEKQKEITSSITRSGRPASLFFKLSPDPLPPAAVLHGPRADGAKPRRATTSCYSPAAMASSETASRQTSQRENHNYIYYYIHRSTAHLSFPDSGQPRRRQRRSRIGPGPSSPHRLSTVARKRGEEKRLPS